jgi:hypothetical protein
MREAGQLHNGGSLRILGELRRRDSLDRERALCYLTAPGVSPRRYPSSLFALLPISLWFTFGDSMTTFRCLESSKRISAVRALIAVLPLALLNGCQSMSNTDKGALAGGGIGAGTGAVIGSATHNTGAGALIGGAVGALAGGLTGAAIDESERKRDAKLAAATAPPAHGPLRIEDVAQLARDHISDEVIINQIRTSATVFRLTVDDINYLKQNGVSDLVIAEMQNTVYRCPRRVYTAAPVVYVEPPPPPPPPVGVGLGFSYSSGGRWR